MGKDADERVGNLFNSDGAILFGVRALARILQMPVMFENSAHPKWSNGSKLAKTVQNGLKLSKTV